MSVGILTAYYTDSVRVDDLVRLLVIIFVFILFCFVFPTLLLENWGMMEYFSRGVRKKIRILWKMTAFGALDRFVSFRFISFRQEKGGRAPVHESKINAMCAANRASLEVGGRWAVYVVVAVCCVMSTSTISGQVQNILQCHGTIIDQYVVCVLE